MIIQFSLWESIFNAFWRRDLDGVPPIYLAYTIFVFVYVYACLYTCLWTFIVSVDDGFVTNMRYIMKNGDNDGTLDKMRKNDDDVTQALRFIFYNFFRSITTHSLLSLH